MTNTEVHLGTWRSEFAKPHFNLIRAQMLIDFLEKNLDIERVFWADAFDTIFQADPFRDHPREGRVGLELFSEVEKIAEDPWNRDRIIACGGDKRFEAEEIVCSGTILGGRAEMLELAKYFVNRLGPHCWSDQGHLQVGLYSGNLSHLAPHISRGGKRVMSFKAIPKTKNDGVVFGGVTPAVIHQYDRLERLWYEFYDRCPHADPELAYIRIKMLDDRNELRRWCKAKRLTIRGKSLDAKGRKRRRPAPRG